MFLGLAAGASCAAAAPSAGRTEILASDARRYLDPATEFPVIRLTDPAYSSFLTASYNRGVSGHNFLLFSNDRSGKLDAYRIDLRSGQSRRVTDAAQLEPGSLALLPGDREFCFIDGASLRLANFGNSREREMYAAAAPYDRLSAVTVMPGGTHLGLVEQRESHSRIRIVPLAAAEGVVDVAESDGAIDALVARPGGGLLWRCTNSVYFSAGREPGRMLALAPGRNGPLFCSHDGAALVYLNIPEKTGELNNIRENVLSSGEDRLVSKTTQYVQFAPNADASVFVGASGSKASPHVLILLRTSRRELTLCEHRARDPRNLAVAFSPNSQRVLFQSDQHGKTAIYLFSVERFVAETES